ncbi:MAG: aminopeptidase P family protein [Gammaproteobacteria bacterium]|nr:aminopeptidase P family protein [Gammaproteobacteria bacterium]
MNACNSMQSVLPRLAGAAAPVPLVNIERARAVLGRHRLDAVVGSGYKNLYYLSGHMPDSVLGHFHDVLGAAILPVRADIAPALCVSDYDLAYLVTRPTWMPDLRLFSSKTRSSASYLLHMISAGVGVDTTLRQPLREIYTATRAHSTEDLMSALESFFSEHVQGGARWRVGFDDPRVGARLAERLGGRIKVVDALEILRDIRMVKTAPELDLLRRSAAINDAAVRDAANAVADGRPIMAMVDAYRSSVVRRGGRFLGERGMMFGAGPDGGFVLDNDWAEARTLARGDIVVYDAIGTYKLYHMDIARTGVIGEPSKRLVELHGIVREALATAESMLRPGVQTMDARAAAEQVIAGRGLEPMLTTMVFHGIGLDILEYGDPSHKTRGWTLEADMAINFEVFYRDPEVGGVHLEDTVRVTPSGLEHFSKLPREIIVTPA